MCPNKGVYDNIEVYVDELLIAAKEPSFIINEFGKT
jgi:hypothetical protein